MTAPGSGKVPIYFGAADRPLFGFFHPASGPSRRSLAVLLCNPIGEDMIRAHRPFRHLAETIAAAGFPVMRFDFDGTGDSAGDERDPNRVATWRADIGRAAAELRRRSGLQAVGLCGLRLGATFAALAAAEIGNVEALVLWGAYDSGGAFVSDLTKVHKMHTMLEPMSFSGGPPAPDGQEALGFLLTTQTMADLAGVELLATTQSPATRTLVIDTANVSLASALANHFKALGSATTYLHLPGQKFLITAPNNSEVPKAGIDAISGWLGDNFPAVETGRAAAPPVAPGISDGRSEALRERAVTFGRATSGKGEDGALFGILTAPPGGIHRADLPGIILINSGTVHRIGVHRTNVPMARRWAALGFHVLRFDLGGIGDSRPAEGCDENLTYPRDRVEDVQAAMDFLARTVGLKTFVLGGLCSGADIAFQVGFQDRRTAGTLLMNPRTFCVNDLKVITSYQHARWYQDSLLRPESWMKLLRGDVDVARAVKIVAPKVKDVVLSRAKRMVGGFLGGTPPAADHSASAAAAAGDVPGCLRAMAERGIDMFLLVTEHDPGVDYIDVNFGRDMRALAGVKNFLRTEIKGTDSTFTARWSQETVATMLTDHLKQRFLAPRAS